MKVWGVGDASRRFRRSSEDKLLRRQPPEAADVARVLVAGQKPTDSAFVVFRKGPGRAMSCQQAIAQGLLAA